MRHHPDENDHDEMAGLDFLTIALDDCDENDRTRPSRIFLPDFLITAMMIRDAISVDSTLTDFLTSGTFSHKIVVETNL